MSRYGIAVATSVLVILLLAACHLLGMLAARALAVICTAIVCWVGVFYALFRSGANRRASDPSLTLPQMSAASATLFSAVYAVDQAREIFLFVILMVFMFGVLRLRTRALMGYAGIVVVAHALVIAMLWRLKPQTLDLRRELLQWLVFALTMPWFAMMGGYIAGLREKLKASLRTVELSESSLAKAQRLAHFGSWSFDPATGTAAWSAETYRILDCDPTRPALTGAAFRALIHEKDRERYARLADQALLDGAAFDTEYRIVLASGATRWVHSIAQLGLGDHGATPVLRGTVLDITQRKQTEERIRQLAQFDTLTGLANRSLIMELSDRALHQALQRGSPLAILFIDLDGFKRINDTLGHAAGDAVLAAFSQRLQHRLGKTHTVARVGGDEFIVLVDDFSSQQDLATIAEKVLTAAGGEVFRFEGHECKVSASIGIAQYPSGGTDVSSLMNSADAAMYRAKHLGKNRYRFWRPAISKLAVAINI